MIDEVKLGCLNERANELSTSHLRTPDHVTTNGNSRADKQTEEQTNRHVRAHAQPANSDERLRVSGIVPAINGGALIGRTQTDKLEAATTRLTHTAMKNLAVRTASGLPKQR
jgi:hypothetical protein